MIVTRKELDGVLARITGRKKGQYHDVITDRDTLGMDVFSMVVRAFREGVDDELGREIEDHTREDAKKRLCFETKLCSDRTLCNILPNTFPQGKVRVTVEAIH